MSNTLPRHSDTVDKIVQTYFACVTKVEFTYKGKIYKPRPLKVSPMIFRGYTCPPGCGGCCKKFTLDYIPVEDERYKSPVGTLAQAYVRKPGGFVCREIEFNGRSVSVITDLQNENTSDFCKHLREKDGRCGIHGAHPFSCDFELIRFLTPEVDPNGSNQLTQKLFGRGWSYKRVDGGKGALCSMTPVTRDSVVEVTRKLRRLEEWAIHFGLTTVLPELIAWTSSGPHTNALYLNSEFANGNEEKKLSLPIFR